MAKVKQGIALIFFLTLLCNGFAQGYPVTYRSIDADTLVIRSFGLKEKFASRAEANTYLAGVQGLLHSRGYVTASVDSLKLDSAKGAVILFLGEQYKWARINTLPQDEPMLQQLRWQSASLDGPVNFEILRKWQQRILDHLEENGRPFGKTYLDDVSINNNEVSATLRIDPGPTYKIDSIRVYGDAKVSNEFLQKYLEIPNGSLYDKKKLQNITRKISELTYLQEERPADLSRLATGSVLNLYLKAKRSSQVNALVGFLPNSDPLIRRKLLLTVDANIMLRNALGAGETIGLLWQQLQKRSPRLNVLYEHPYVFRSPFGLAFTLDMYKQDSIFLNINMRLGANYKTGANQSATVFLQRRQSIVNSINTAAIILTKKLPAEADVSSLNLGFDYLVNSTDYRFNPRKGSELSVTSSAGTKKIRKNSQVLDLKDPSNPSYKFETLYDTLKQKVYQVRLNISAAHFLPIGSAGTFKIGGHGGVYQSANYFRNELFQIGGYKLMRGFNEESQFVSRYAIGTVEYRYLIGLNSAFFAFFDGGWGHHRLELRKNHSYLGTGLGLSFETKAGIVNLVWAVGKRDDTDMNLRQSKIHIGFASYF